MIRKVCFTCKANASYISKTTQNEILECCAKYITDDIISRVKKAKYYSIIADECSDSSSKEQLSLVLRYVDPTTYEIREEFVRFLHCELGLSGDALFKTLTTCLEKDLGLSISNIRGQAYDGAGAIAGKNKGLAALILLKNMKALYTHCYSDKFQHSKRLRYIPIIGEMLSKRRYLLKNSPVKLDFLDKSIEA